MMKTPPAAGLFSILTVVAAFVALLLPWSSCGDEPQNRLLAEKIFNRVESRFLDIRTLSYAVERTLESGRIKQKERWTFKFRHPNDLRIECLAPSNRLIVLNGKTLWEYIPEAGKAVRTELDPLSEAKRQKVVATVLSHVAVEGIRLGDYAGMLDRVSSVHASATNRELCVVEGTSPRYVVCIDTARNVLIRTELCDTEGRLRLRTEASRFLEVIPSFWFPREMRVMYRAGQGLMESIVNIHSICANQDMRDDLFEFVPSEGVTVIDN